MKTHAQFLEELKTYIIEDQIPYYESINREEPNNDTLYELNILLEKIERFEAEQKEAEVPFYTTIDELKLHDELMKHINFLGKLKESIKAHTYKDYFRDDVVAPEKILDEIEDFQAEQKANNDKR